jgi:hypothetical protein
VATIFVVNSSSSGRGDSSGSSSSSCFGCGSVGGGSQKEMAVGSRVILEVFCHFGGGGLIRGDCYNYLPLKI